MKILECHIENFGKFSDETFHFDDGFNVICADNGYGKSTLAIFIKVMFFGFDNYNGHDKLRNERKRFTPWQGGVFGGSIKFSAGNRTFLIERVFGKRKSEDKFTLRDAETNLIDDTYSENIGEELFQIDSDSFLRTVFITQSNCDTQTTDSINAKIGNLAENTDDINNYDTAMEKLKNLQNKLAPNKKTGGLYKMKDRILELETRIKGGEWLDEKEKQLILEKDGLLKSNEKLNAEKEEIKKNEAEARRQKDLQIKRGQYSDLKKAFNARKSDAETARGYFHGDIPKENELDEITVICSALLKKQSEADACALQDKDKEFLQRFSKNTVPNSAELEEKEAMQKKLDEIALEKAKYTLSLEEEAALERLGERFEGKKDLSDEIDSKISDCSIMNERKNLIGSKKASYNMMKNLSDTKKYSDSKKLPLIIAAVIVMIVSAVACVKFNTVLGAAGMIIALIIFVISLLKKPETAENFQSKGLSEMYNEILNDEKYISDTENKIREFLSVFGIEYDENTAFNELRRLKEDMRDYFALSKEKQQYESIEKGAEELRQELNGFIKRYYDDAENSGAKLRQLQDAVKEYNRIKDSQKRFDTLSLECGEYRARIREYLSALAFLPEDDLGAQMLKIRDALKVYQRCNEEYITAKTDKEKFEAENAEIIELLNFEGSDNIKDLAQFDAELTALNEKITENDRKIAETDREMALTAEEKEGIEDDKNTLSELKAEFEKDRIKFERLEKTNKFLEKAKQSFTSKYTAPLMSAFSKYYGNIGVIEKVHMDADINITVDEKGMQRETRFLSSGIKSFTDVCMRMALADTMYAEEKPVLIFDDPFVFADEKHLTAGREFLNKASENYQIIYFTCNKGRA